MMTVIKGQGGFSMVGSLKRVIFGKNYSITKHCGKA
jgi:hypothetical protein